MNVIDVIHEVSLDLNDQEKGYEYTRWTIPQLHSYLREAVWDLSGKFKEYFINRKIVQVAPGADWQRACDCTEIISIVGESNSTGLITRTLQFFNPLQENILSSDVINACSEFSGPMSRYSINPVDSTQFKVYPPVRGGEKKYIVVECFQRPATDLDSSIPDDLVPIVKQWMLYRALIIDSENNSVIINVAGSHRETYVMLLKSAMEMREYDRKRYDSLRAIQKNPSS